MNFKNKIAIAILLGMVSVPTVQANGDHFPSLEEMQALMNKAKQQTEPSKKINKFKKLNEKQASQLIVKSLVDCVRTIPLEQVALLGSPSNARKLPALSRKRQPFNS